MPSNGPGQAEGASEYLGATVVVGSTGTGGGQQAAVWLSPQPGAPFASVIVPVVGASSNMSMVSAGPLGFFAVGTIDGRFAMWSSADGKEWSELTSAETTIDSTGGARVDALLAEKDKVIVAGSAQSGANQSAAVWLSGDGLHWKMVNTAQPAFAGTGDRAIYALAPLGTGLVAVGALNYGAGWLPASWISPDGNSWSQPSVDFPGLVEPTSPSGPFGPSGGFAVRSVSAVATFTGSTSLIAAGGGASGQDAWRSNDGIHWTPVGLPGRDILSGAWRASLAAATATTAVVADSDPGEAHLVSGAPGAWSEPSASPSVFGPVQARADPLSLRPGGSGLVLAVQVINPTQAIGPPNTSISYLTSADGSTWTPTNPATTDIPATLPASRSVVLKAGPSSWVAGGDTAALAAVGWSSGNSSVWTAAGSLYGSHPVRQASLVDGVCLTSSGEAAAVGTVASSQGSLGAAWLFHGVSASVQASVSPAPATGGTESISGCLNEGTGLVAYGMSTGSGGVPVPALWRSTDGSVWVRSSPSGFGSDSPAPLVDLAASGDDWIAIANPDPQGGPIESATSGQVAPDGPASAAGTDGAVGPVPSLGNGEDAVWLSADGGSTWQLINTSVPPWPGTSYAAVDLVGFAGKVPVVIGVADGQLAVWTGTALSTSPGASSQPTG